MKKIADACSYLLNNYPEACKTKEYLDSRLLHSTQEAFQFGYFPDSFNLNALINLVGEHELIDNNLLYFKLIEDSVSPRKIPISFFENYQMIVPFKNVYGEIISLVGRTLLSEEERQNNKISKYKNTSFHKGNHLFGLFENKEAIIKENSVFIVEGQFDVIKAFEKKIYNVVALGNSNMTAFQFSLILRYTDNIRLLLDNDQAGLKGRESIISKYGTFANITNSYIPKQFKDIDEYLSHDLDINLIS